MYISKICKKKKNVKLLSTYLKFSSFIQAKTRALQFTVLLNYPRWGAPITVIASTKMAFGSFVLSLCL